MKKLSIILLIFVSLFSCAPKSAEEVGSDGVAYDMAVSQDKALEEEIEVMQTAEDVQNSSPGSDKVVIRKKIIKDGRMGIEVNDLNLAKSKVDSLLKIHGAYYDNEELTNNGGNSIYSLKIRIPSARFEKFLTQTEKGEKKILYKEIKAQDVTEEFIDLETRLGNKKSYVAQYKNLLSRAKNVEEILQIQEKLRVLEEEIESTTGRLRYLNDQVDFSTLELNLIKENDFKFTPENRAKFSERLKQSLSGGWYNLVDFMLALLSNWALLILFGVILYFLVKAWRKRKAKKAKKS
jgi:hypothetical protein